MLRASLYVRVSTNDQQTLALEGRAMREYAARRDWVIALQVREMSVAGSSRETAKGFGALNRPPRYSAPLARVGELLANSTRVIYTGL